jgi:hypothetical protein
VCSAQMITLTVIMLILLHMLHTASQHNCTAIELLKSDCCIQVSVMKHHSIACEDNYSTFDDITYYTVLYSIVC